MVMRYTPGMAVQFIGPYYEHGSFTQGKVYVVGGPYYEEESNDVWTFVEKDDNGRANGGATEYFVPAGGPW